MCQYGAHPASKNDTTASAPLQGTMQGASSKDIAYTDDKFHKLLAAIDTSGEQFDGKIDSLRRVGLSQEDSLKVTMMVSMLETTVQTLTAAAQLADLRLLSHQVQTRSLAFHLDDQEGRTKCNNGCLVGLLEHAKVGLSFGFS
ncbi:hypothetical protein NDU88_008351 [Pleurodeles waltl]|uniref:Uncharacterized protein n=1 Tax=Pleurodeles waltl TaxID=8319 RepID=A0AAV7QUA7_PLEWA|nr:hypothetical protein NDU88_008351 [Pleurodeles waltl]